MLLPGGSRIARSWRGCRVGGFESPIEVSACSLYVSGRNVAGFEHGPAEDGLGNGCVLLPRGFERVVAVGDDDGAHDVRPPAVHHLLDDLVAREPVQRDMEFIVRPRGVLDRGLGLEFVCAFFQGEFEPGALFITDIAVSYPLRGKRCGRGFERLARLVQQAHVLGVDWRDLQSLAPGILQQPLMFEKLERMADWLAGYLQVRSQRRLAYALTGSKHAQRNVGQQPVEYLIDEQRTVVHRVANNFNFHRLDYRTRLEPDRGVELHCGAGSASPSCHS